MSAVWRFTRQYYLEDIRGKSPTTNSRVPTHLSLQSQEKNEFSLQGQGALMKVTLSEVICTKVHYKVHVLASGEVEESSTSDDRDTDHDSDSDDDDDE